MREVHKVASVEVDTPAAPLVATAARFDPLEDMDLNARAGKLS